MNSVCVLTIASFGGAANPFSPRFKLLLHCCFSIIQVANFFLLLLVGSLRHFFAVFENQRKHFFFACIWRYSRLHRHRRLFMRQFSDSIWFTCISTSMQCKQPTKHYLFQLAQLCASSVRPTPRRGFYSLSLTLWYFLLFSTLQSSFNTKTFFFIFASFVFVACCLTWFFCSFVFSCLLIFFSKKKNV